MGRRVEVRGGNSWSLDLNLITSPRESRDTERDKKYKYDVCNRHDASSEAGTNDRIQHASIAT